MGFLWPSPFFAEKDRFKGAVAQRACRSDVSLGWSSRWSESNRFSAWWVKFFQWVDKKRENLNRKHQESIDIFPWRSWEIWEFPVIFPTETNQLILGTLKYYRLSTNHGTMTNQDDRHQTGEGCFFRKVPWKRSAMLPDVASFKTLHWVFSITTFYGYEGAYSMFSKCLSFKYMFCLNHFWIQPRIFRCFSSRVWASYTKKWLADSWSWMSPKRCMNGTKIGHWSCNPVSHPPDCACNIL